MPRSEPSVDAVIIGAGFSGLAAALRLARFGKRVVVLEAHNLPGGLNSYYYRRPGKRLFNAGLHTFTNYRRTHPKWGRHLLFRSLGLTDEEIRLHPPRLPALVLTPSQRIEVREGFAEMRETLSSRFGIGGECWQRFETAVVHDSVQPRDEAVTDIAMLGTFFAGRELVDLLRMPVYLYAGYREHSLPWAIFASIFRSLWIDGYCSPANIKVFLDRLLEHLRACGADVRFRAGVRRIVVDRGAVRGVVLETGEEIAAHMVISSAGGAETARLAGATSAPALPAESAISAFETVLDYDGDTVAEGATHSLVFASFRRSFDWTLEAVGEGVPYLTASVSDAYAGDIAAFPHQIKIGSYCAGRDWIGRTAVAYAEAKARRQAELIESLKAVFPGVRAERARLVESLTPATVARYTHHVDGAIYGAQAKNFSGVGESHGLYICGNDQGGIGIIGAAISGLAMANRALLDMSREAGRTGPD